MIQDIIHTDRTDNISIIRIVQIHQSAQWIRKAKHKLFSL